MSPAAEKYSGAVPLSGSLTVGRRSTSTPPWPGGLVAMSHSRPRAAHLVIGYKVVRRALHLDSDDVSLKSETHSYL